MRGQESITPRNQSRVSLKSKFRYLEFKYLYFQIQQQINNDVTLSFKYEQLKTPELRISLIKPLVSMIVELSNTQALRTVLCNQFATSPGLTTIETPLFGPVGYGSLPIENPNSPRISLSVIYVLLLLRYEYMIQSENHLIMYDLLVTKSTICEFLAIRMLREYSSNERINLLFINPMAHHDEHVQLKHTKHLDSFNTLELSILSKSKRFLAQPVIIGILDRIYNGELIMKDKNAKNPKGWLDKASSPSSTTRNIEDSYMTAKRGLFRDFESSQIEAETQGSLDGEEYERSIVNYKFNKITIEKVFVRSNVVPKYQSLVINLKYGFLTILFLILVFKHKLGQDSGLCGPLFWVVALSFNFDVIVKSLFIEFKFLKKIIWTYIDILIVTLINISFVMRVLLGFDKINNRTYHNCFSLISILLFPRMLSVFNNYEFFNMIIVSLKKMTWNVIALSFLFTSLIFGFFLCFTSLAIDMSTYEVAFAMVKIFFGFTPAVWDNWESFDNLGRTLQLSYLSLIQFVFATILAIVLSNVFAKVSETNKEEFEYLKTTNLIIYLKWASFKLLGVPESKVATLIDYAVTASKFPIILIIYFYEILIKENKKLLQKQQKDLKNFTFLNREDDLYKDDDMMMLGNLDMGEEISSLRLTSRRGSQIDPRVVSTGEANAAATIPLPAQQESHYRKRVNPKKLIPQQSQATIAGFRSGLLDSVFIDNFLGKRYGSGRLRNASGLRSKRVRSETENERNYTRLNEQLMYKLQNLEELMSQLIKEKSDVNNETFENFAVREYKNYEPDPTTMLCFSEESVHDDFDDEYLETENTESESEVFDA